MIDPLKFLGLDDFTQKCATIGIEVNSETKIVMTICKYFKVDYNEVLSNNNRREISMARMFSIGIISKVSKMKVVQIGKMFNKHHSTIIYNRDLFFDLIYIKDVQTLMHIEKIGLKL
jgi:chromosomal replication initiation ATPase DnaA